MVSISRVRLPLAPHVIHFLPSIFDHAAFQGRRRCMCEPEQSESNRRLENLRRGHSLIPGSIPSAYYSSTDPASFKEFLGKCDILIASLPSTAATKYMLTLDHLSTTILLPFPGRKLMAESLPDGAVFINVGRGDLVRSGASSSFLPLPLSSLSHHIIAVAPSGP